MTDFSVTAFNFIDLVALFVLFLSVIGGIKRGFISGFLDIFGLVAGIYLAFKGYRPIGGLVTDSFPVPRGIASLAAFIGLFVVSQIAFSIVFSLLVRVIKRLLRSFPLFSLGDAVAGALPGVVKGIVGVTLLMLPFGLFPIVPEVKAAIEKSFLGSRLISAASEAAPRLESLFGQGAEDTLIFLSRPEPGESIKLNFPPPSELLVDANSEQKMLELINAERIKAGLKPLVMDEKLQLAARGHSKEMFELSYFAHDSPVAGSPADRMRAAGAKFDIAAENIAYAPNVEIAHSGLMNSPGHRKGILTPGFSRVGIGVIDGGLSGKMFTQNFTD